MSWTARIFEDDNDEWNDDEIHTHYNVPMVAVRANPHILMHCDVRRDTASNLRTSVSINKWINTEYFIWELAAGLADTNINPKLARFFEENYQATWVQVQEEFDGIADLPERFLHKVEAPPFHVVELRIQSGQIPRYWRLRANTGKDMVDTAFWNLWKSILKREVPTAGHFDVMLKAPTRIPTGEDPIDPWSVSPSNDSYVKGHHEYGCHLGHMYTFDNPTPWDFSHLLNEGYGDVYPSINRGRTSSCAALKSLSHHFRGCISRSRSRERDQVPHRSQSSSTTRMRSLIRRMRCLDISKALPVCEKTGDQ